MSPRDDMTPAPVPEGAVEETAGPPVSHPGSGPAIAPEIEIPLLDVVLSGVQVWLRGMSGSMPDSQRLVSEFTVGSRLLAAGQTEAALRVLLPAQQPLA